MKPKPLTKKDIYDKYEFQPYDLLIKIEDVLSAKQHFIQLIKAKSDEMGFVHEEFVIDKLNEAFQIEEK